MATLYFNAAIDNDWSTLGNWWLDETLTTPATSLPTSADSVIALATISSNSGIAPTIVNFTLADTNFSNNQLDIAITVTSIATFNNGGIIWTNGSVVGNCVFNNSSSNSSVITGDCTFNDFSYQGGAGYITGNCIFNNNSTVSGTIVGNCTFNDNSYNNGQVLGDAIFNNSSYCGSPGTVAQNVICNDTSSYLSNIDGSFPENLAPASITCYDSSYTEIGYGASRETTCNYYNTSYNKGHIANSVFHDNSYNFADFPNGIYGYLLDSATFNDNSINYGFLGGPISRTPTVVFNDYSMNNGPADSPNYPVSVTFNHNSYNTYNIIVSTITFNNNSYSSSAVSAVDCNINGPKPIIIGAFNNETVVAPYYSNGRIQIPSFSRAGLGVNGSNILGVI